MASVSARNHWPGQVVTFVPSIYLNLIILLLRGIGGEGADHLFFCRFCCDQCDQCDQAKDPAGLGLTLIFTLI